MPPDRPQEQNPAPKTTTSRPHTPNITDPAGARNGAGRKARPATVTVISIITMTTITIIIGFFSFGKGCVDECRMFTVYLYPIDNCDQLRPEQEKSPPSWGRKGAKGGGRIGEIFANDDDDDDDDDGSGIGGIGGVQRC
uniref:Uncharacterized protein n=1 Tax=Anopheles atroparvus TaxID=41427 RepID=A0A182IJY9_ANOAO